MDDSYEEYVAELEDRKVKLKWMHENVEDFSKYATNIVRECGLDCYDHVVFDPSKSGILKVIETETIIIHGLTKVYVTTSKRWRKCPIGIEIRYDSYGTLCPGIYIRQYKVELSDLSEKLTKEKLPKDIVNRLVKIAEKLDDNPVYSIRIHSS